jgi:Flp pilus assembly pilin Flp
VQRFRAVVRRSDGGQASEYALLLALVAAGLFIALMLFGTSLGQSYGRVANRVGSSTQTQETGAVAGGGGGGGGGAAASSAQSTDGDRDRERHDSRKAGKDRCQDRGSQPDGGCRSERDR